MKTSAALAAGLSVGSMAFAKDSQSSMRMDLKIVVSFIGGSLITAISALVPNTGVMGALAFGFPFPWLSQSIYPAGGPMILNFTGLVLDLLVWATVSFIVITLTLKFRKGNSDSVPSAM